MGFTLDFIVIRGAGTAYHQLLPYDQCDELICMGFNNHLTNWLFRISRISVNIYSQIKSYVFCHPENG